MDPRFNLTEIIPNLFIGNSTGCKDADQFSLVVNCTTDQPFYSSTVENVRINLDDEETSDEGMIHELESKSVLPKILACLQHNQKVLVHCHVGMSRSPTVVLCFLLQYVQDMTVLDAIDLIVRRRPIVFQLGYNFKKTIKHFTRK